jgi:hypothetical protein
MEQEKLSLGIIHSEPRHEDVWGSGGVPPQFLTLVLDRGEWSASHAPTAFPRRISSYRLLLSIV